MSYMPQRIWNMRMRPTIYGVATISRIDKITGLFCKRDL